MADKSINDLVQASGIQDEDLFVLQQGATARSASGALMKSFIMGMGGIQNAVFNASNHTLTLVFTDGSTYTTGSLQGDRGVQGIQGVSPTITATPFSTGNGGYDITVVDAEHPDGQTFRVYNGADGAGSVSKVDGISAVAGNVTTRFTRTGTLAVNGWSGLLQNVNVSGLGANDVVIVSPTASSHDEYIKASVRCTAQDTGILTFGCTKLPTTPLSLNILVFKVV